MTNHTRNPGPGSSTDLARSGQPQSYPSGSVVSSMVTTPDLATMRLAAIHLGVDAQVAASAAEALRQGTATAVVFSGKLASGKDTVAEHVGFRLEAAGLAPAEVHRTSGPIRAELDQVIALVTQASSEDDATHEVVRQLGFPPVAAAHMVHELFGPSRTEELSADVRSDSNRHLLQYLADEGRRSLDPDYWVRQVFAGLLVTLAAGRTALLSGGRYPNEIVPAQALGMMTVRLAISRKVQEERLKSRDGVEHHPDLLDNPNECALDAFSGFNLVVGNDDQMEPTVDTVTREVLAHVDRLRHAAQH